MADKLGSTKVTNIVLMGALLEETECLAPATAMSVLETKIKKMDLLELDRQALDAGRTSSTTRCASAPSANPTASPTKVAPATCPERSRRVLPAVARPSSPSLLGLARRPTQATD